MRQKQKSVLHVITSINRGGAENHLVDLIRGQLARGWDVGVAYLKGDGYWTDVLRAARCDVFDLRMSRYGNPAAVLRLRKVIAVRRPNVLHAHMAPAELYSRLALPGFDDVHFVISKHNDSPFWRFRAAKVVERWVAARASMIIGISEAVRTYMIDTVGIVPEKLVTIHYGLDENSYRDVTDAMTRQVRAGLGCSPEEYIIGTVARLVPQKALHVLIRAFAAYVERATVSARLVIVGTGPLLDELRHLAHSLGVASAVVFAGFRSDIAAVHAAFDVFALTSVFEGFGLVLLEAMAAARPIVATRVSAIPEVIVDGTTGLLVEPGNLSGIAEKFLFFEDPSRRRVFGAAGRRRVIESFDLDKMVDRTIACYGERPTGSFRTAPRVSNETVA